MSVERHPSSITGMSDDELGTAAVALVIGELQWSPDVAPAVLDRISRDTVAYPEQFDRRMVAPRPRRSLAGERSAKRAVGRLAVFGFILVLVVGIVAFAATASVRAAGPGPRDATVGSDVQGLPGLASHPTDVENGRGLVDDTCADAGLVPADAAATVPNRAIDGTLMSFGVDQSGGLRLVGMEGRIIHVVTEAS